MIEIFMHLMKPYLFKKVLVGLSLFHIVIIATSNYLVQLPITIFGFNTTWGAFTFPFIFLATDLTVRIYGPLLARRIIFAVMMPALLLSYVISVLFFNGVWTGFMALGEFNLFVGRIAFASFSAYFVGQLIDIAIFTPLRKKGTWWLAPVASAVLGNLMDTLVFFNVGFRNSDNLFMRTHLVEISMVDYGFKLLICALFFLPLYGIILDRLQRKLTNRA